MEKPAPSYLSICLLEQEVKCKCPWSLIWLFHSSVTTPGTEASETQKATTVPGSPSKTPEEVSTPPEEDRLYLQTPTSSERGGSPIIQEPEEPSEHREESSPRKTSLVIVESADNQPETHERLDEDAAFEKVRHSSPLSRPPVTKLQIFQFPFLWWFVFFTSKQKS